MNLVVVANTVNLTTPVGLGIAKAAGCRISRRGSCWQATGYAWPLPVAAGFTVGCVVISRQPLSEVVWEHEMVHVRQYAWLGPALWPAYLLAAGWSYLRTGDWWSRNVFERRAGLRAGGYRERPIRNVRRRPPAGSAADAVAV